MQATARRLSVVSATSCARRRLIRNAPRNVGSRLTFLPVITCHHRSFAGFASSAILVMIVAHSLWLFPENLQRGSMSTALTALGAELLFAIPAIAYLLGVRWARCIVAIQCIIILPLWLLTPLALHEVDRSTGFWVFWPLSVLVLLYSAVASWIPPKRVYDRPSTHVPKNETPRP